MMLLPYLSCTTHAHTLGLLFWKACGRRIVYLRTRGLECRKGSARSSTVYRVHPRRPEVPHPRDICYI